MAKLTKTSTPGIFRRHRRDCPGGRCDCAYAVVWRHRGRQSMETFATLAEAREAKGQRDAGDRRPASREPFEDYARQWLITYRGRTSRGLSERTRGVYRRDMERWTIPYFRGCRLDEIEPPDVRAFIDRLDNAGLRPNSVRSEALANMPDRQQAYEAMVERMSYLLPPPERWTELIDSVIEFVDPLLADDGRLSHWDPEALTWR